MSKICLGNSKPPALVATPLISDGPFKKMCKNLAPKNLKIIKNCAKIRKINFFRPKLCIKSGFCNEPKNEKLSKFPTVHSAKNEKFRRIGLWTKNGQMWTEDGQIWTKMGRFGQKWADLDQK